VTGYEVQMCEPTGPIQTKIGFPSNTDDDPAENNSNGYDFHTVAEVVTNELVVPNLRPGIRYQFRVRPKFDDCWLDWSFGQYSDIVTMTASVPDSPVDVKRAMIRSIFKGSRPQMMHITELREESKIDTSSQIDYVNVAQNPSSSSIYDESGCMEIHQPAITHDSIVISWTNRQPNGSPIEECGIEMAKVKDYNHDDAQLCLKATGKISAKASDDEKLDSSQLKWIDISQTGTFLGASEFKIGSLTAASGYVFRVRQKNGCGWSEWSLASDVIYTLAAAPPSAPEAINIGPSHAVLEWGPSDERFKYTSLDYELQFSRYDTKRGATSISDDDEDESGHFEWFVPMTHRCDIPDLSAMSMTLIQRKLEAETKAAIEHERRAVDNDFDTAAASDRFDCKRVFVDKLVPATAYVARVRIYTVTGWTSWSQLSAPFRTLGAN
jgi:hypothetical protein